MSSVVSPSSSAPVDWQSDAAITRRKRRYAREARLRWLGIGAIVTACSLLALLLVSLTINGYRAFTQTMVAVDVFVDPEVIDRAVPGRGNWRALLETSVKALLPDLPDDQVRRATSILTNNSRFLIRDYVVARPHLVGERVTIQVPASDPFDQLNKGLIDRELPENRRRVNDVDLALFDRLAAEGRITAPFNWALLTNADSRFPELAGLAGAIVGSALALLVCFLLSFPLGVGAAVYLEEFAPKNRWTDLIEVNINNLAAVPSIVFGLLGLAVFLGWFGMPRSAPLVGGMVLALMTLPTIIIVTRNALKAVPPSIREAALGVGASRHEMVVHHVLPLALPGILTGTIIGLAQALGETAPLLLIGMNAFITSPPGGLLDASTALPTQIFIWADSPERGFVSRTAAGILVLMGFLLVMNAVAIFLRQRLERKW